MFVSVAGVDLPSDMPPADGRRTKMCLVSIADLCAAARTPVAFVKSWGVLGLQGHVALGNPWFYRCFKAMSFVLA